MFRILVFFGVLFYAQSVAAQPCTTNFSNWGVSVDDFNWTPYEDYRYTICYDTISQTHVEDLEYTRRWVNYSYDIAASKYGITHPIGRLQSPITIFLYPSPTNRVSSSTAANYSIYDDSAEVHILTATEYSLGRGEPLEAFAKVLIHEMMNVLFLELDEYRMPSWIREGLSEFEGYMSTPWGRNYMITTLPQRVRREDIIFGWDATSFKGSDTTLQVSEVYFAGAVVVTVLAEQFGEEIHRELFDSHLNYVLAKRQEQGNRRARKWNVFKEIVFWLDRYGAR